MTTIDSFVKRLNKLGIDVQLVSNYPWVYLDRVNGYKVLERFQAKHGFTIFFRAIRMGEVDRITDIPEIFKTIRKYL